jgi:multidrug resistance efflux pump
MPNLRARAFRTLRTSLGRIAGRGADAPDVPRRERRIHVVYAVLSAVFSVLLLGMIGRWIGGWLIDRYEFWGLLAFIGLLILLFRGLLGRAGGALRTIGRSAVRAGPRGWLRSPLVIVAALVALLALVRMPLHVVGDFVVAPAHNTDIRARVEGILEEMLVREGDRVEAGDLIARLSDRDLRADLEQVRAEIAERRARHRLLVVGPRPEEVEVARIAVAKADERLKYARSQLQRLESLHDQRLSSLKDYEDAKEQVAVRTRELEESEGELRLLLAGSRSEEIDAVEAELSRLETRMQYLEGQLARVRIETPLAGVVTTPDLDERVGEYVERGDLIAEVHAIQTVTAEIAVPESEISDVILDQPVALKVRAYPSRTFEGKVASIAPTVTSSTGAAPVRTIKVITRLDNPDLLLKPEMTGTAKIVCGKRRLGALIVRRLSRVVRLEFWSWW